MFYVDETTEIERGVSQVAADGLTARGHSVVVRPLPHGGGQGICIDWDPGNLIGGSTPSRTAARSDIRPPLNEIFAAAGQSRSGVSAVRGFGDHDTRTGHRT